MASAMQESSTGAADQAGSLRFSVTVPAAISPAAHGLGAFTLYSLSVQAKTSYRGTGALPGTMSHAATRSMSWTCAKRYSDFVTLHEGLTQIWDTCTRPQAAEDARALPALPPKVWLGSSLDPTVVETRRQLLEKFLQTVLLTPDPAVSQLIGEFLEQPAHLLIASEEEDRSTTIVDNDEQSMPPQNLERGGELGGEMERFEVSRGHVSASTHVTETSSEPPSVAVERQLRELDAEPANARETEPESEPSSAMLDFNGTCMYRFTASACLLYEVANARHYGLPSLTHFVSCRGAGGHNRNG